MIRRLILVNTAALALAVTALPTRAWADDPAKTGDNTVKSAVDKNGTTPAPDAEGIRDTVASATEATVTKGGFDDLVERFVDADRNRLGKSGVVEQDHPKLDGRIAQFQKDWKAKYNQDFDIKNEDTVFNDTFAMIRQGEIPGEPRLAGERKIGDTMRNPNGNTDANGNKDSSHIAGGDVNREPGRNVATVTIMASNDMPEVVVPMIHEAPDSWKIDLPDDITAQQLHDNLLTALTKCDENKANWPADVNDAYRAVTHQVFAAILSVPQSNTDKGRQ